MDKFKELLSEHQWTVVLVVIGIVLTILLLTIGFLRTLLLVAIVAVCFVIGMKLDKNGEDIKKTMNRIFKKKD